MRRSLGRAFLLGIVVGIVVALVRRARRATPPLPPPGALGRPTPALAPHIARRPVSSPVGAPSPTPVADAAMTPAPTIDPEPAPDRPAPDGAEPAPETTASSTSWIAPIDGGCPDGYPVKAKEASGIFHVPGGLSYARTRPDRCYASPEAATADGFRPAQR